MVGIAGGAPSAQHDVRLGDIVVSTPDKQSGGIIHYDFGKTIQTKKFQRTGTLNSPPLVLLNAIQRLSAERTRKGNRIAETADQLVRNKENLKDEYKRPEPGTDQLYRANYIHQDADKSCNDACDQSGFVLESRPERPKERKEKSVVHYGLIASSDRLMKDAEVHDALSQMKGFFASRWKQQG